MKAITIWQPWASLLACGAKQYETRSWKTNYRGPIAIHAARKDPCKMSFLGINEFYAASSEALKKAGCGSTWGLLPTGSIIAIAELVNVWHIVAHPGTNIDIAKHISIGAESITIDKHALDFSDYFVPTEQEILFGDWTPGRYAWELTNVKILDKPIPAKGQQRLWNWEVEMKYFEFKEPYYALIKAEDEEKAMEVYVEIVADIDDDNFEIEEVTEEYAWEKFSNVDIERDRDLTLSELEAEFNTEENSLLLIDGSLI